MTKNQIPIKQAPTNQEQVAPPQTLKSKIEDYETLLDLAAKENDKKGIDEAGRKMQESKMAKKTGAKKNTKKTAAETVDEHTEVRNDYISVREFAERMGVKHTAIIRAMDIGWIEKGVYVHPANGHRKILPDIAKEEWEQNQNPAMDHFREMGKKNTGKKLAEKRGGGNSDSSTLTSVKTQEAKVKLQVDLIKLRKLKGELVEKDAVYDALFEFGRLIRDTIMVVPDRIIDRIMAAKTRNEAHIILTEELDDALRGLSDADKVKIGEDG